MPGDLARHDDLHLGLDISGLHPAAVVCQRVNLQLRILAELYIGRVHRYNSWDALTQPGSLLETISSRLADPFGRPGTIVALLGPAEKAASLPPNLAVLFSVAHKECEALGVADALDTSFADAAVKEMGPYRKSAN